MRPRKKIQLKPAAARIRPGAARAGRLFASLTGRHVTPRMTAGWAASGLLAGLAGHWEAAVCGLLLPVLLLTIWHCLRGIARNMARPETRAAREEALPPPPLPGTPWPVRLWYWLTVPPPRYRGDPAALDPEGTVPDGTACLVCGCTRRAPCRPGCDWQPAPGLCAGCDILVPLVRVTGDGPYAAVLLVTPDAAETARIPAGGESGDPPARDQALAVAGRRFAAARGWEPAGAWRPAVGGSSLIARVTGRKSSAGRTAVTPPAGPAEITGGAG